MVTTRHLKIVIVMTIVATVLIGFSVYGKLALPDEESEHVVINEVCSNNFSIICDETTEYYDYVELYNPRDFSTDMELYLTDDRDDLKKYKVEESIPAGGYLVIWFAGAENEGYLHAPFKLSDGEPLILTTEDGTVLDEVRIPSLEHDVTYSRQSDGGRNFFYATGTPGASNDGATWVEADYNQEPSFSLEDGFYEVGTSLSIKARFLDKIYYTIDGSLPDENSHEYSGPITLLDASDNDNNYSVELVNPDYIPPSFKIDKANVIRAIAVNRFTGKKSRIVSHVYFCGFQDKKEYDGMKIISLMLDPDDLFGYEDGILALGAKYDEYRQMTDSMDLAIPDAPGEYVDDDGVTYYRYEFSNAANRGRKYEKEAIMSVFDENHDMYYTQNVGIRIAGESSRSNYQKSFNLYARSAYDGNNSFLKGFFEENEKKVRLRNDGYLAFHEAFVQEAAENIGLLTQRAEPCVLFLNGEYWGIYDIKEQYDARFFLNQCGIDESNLWVRKNDVIEYGSGDAEDSYEFLISMLLYADSSEDEVYDAICELVDIDDLIDYFCFLLFFNEEDIIPEHNQIAFRSAEEGNSAYEDCKWRYLVFDEDETMGDPERNTIELYRELGDDMYLPGLLYKNDGFREQFWNRMKELVNGPFSYDVLHEQLMEFDDIYRMQNIATLMRYFDLSREKATQKYNEELERTDSFLRERREYILGYLEEDLASH